MVWAVLHVARKIAATLARRDTRFSSPRPRAHGAGHDPQGYRLLRLRTQRETELNAVVGRQAGWIINLQWHRRPHASDEVANSGAAAEGAQACPVNIAPTTSTTLMLALGDALAVATMRVRGLTRERLQLLHPGGSIGDRLQPVEMMMHTGAKLPLVAHDAPMLEVVLEMTRKSFGIAGVVEQGELIGVITDGDLRRHSAQLFDLLARDV